jgi:serine/threonine protein kinase
MFYALRKNLALLRRYYENLQPTGNPRTAGTRFFPSITAYREGNDIIDFEYQGFLEDDPSCLAIRARTCTELPRDIVVKFVDRYGERAHRVLAEEGLAPKILYCGSPRLEDSEGQPSYHSLLMVVMEYVNGEPLFSAKLGANTETLQRVRDEVRRALDLLHSKGLVFGDLRPPNVMVTNATEVKLIDFDWAGEHGQAKYPHLISPNVDWPAGVRALDIIEYSHDLDMLDRLL